MFADGKRKYCGQKVEISVDGSRWAKAVDLGASSGTVATSSGYVMNFDEVHTARYLRVFASRNSLNTATHLLDVAAKCTDEAKCKMRSVKKIRLLDPLEANREYSGYVAGRQTPERNSRNEADDFVHSFI